MDFPATFAAAGPRLTAHPVGRTLLGIRSLRLALDEDPTALDAVLPVAGDVLVGLVLDDGGAGTPVSDGMLRQWGVTLEQAIAASFEVHGTEDPRIERVDGVTVITDRSFAAFLLRTPATARALVSGTPCAFVPTDEHVVIAAAEDAASVAAAARVADRLVQDARTPVSAVLLRATGEAWAPIAAPAAAEPFTSDFARRLAWLGYGLQRPLLQAFYDRTGQDCLVADAVLARRSDGPGGPAWRTGALQLVATVTEGVPTALPWVDALTLVSAHAVVGMPPMAELVVVPGLLTPLPDLVPPRWYPTRFPAEVAG